MSDLIIAGALLLHQTPRLSIVTVGDFEHRHKLHHPEVFGPLSDDARQALCLLQIDLERQQRQKQLSSATLLFVLPLMTLWGFAHLDPLGAIVVCRRPGVRLPLLVQSGKLRVPGESVDAPRAVRAGGRELAVWDEARLHPQRLWATCRVWIHCELKADGRTEGGDAKATGRERERRENEDTRRENILTSPIQRNSEESDWLKSLYTHHWPRGTERGAQSRRKHAVRCTELHMQCVYIHHVSLLVFWMLYSKNSKDEKNEAEENHKCAFLSLCLPWIAGLLLHSEVTESCLCYTFSIRPFYVVSINTLTVIMLVSTATARRNKHGETEAESSGESSRRLKLHIRCILQPALLSAELDVLHVFLCVYRWVHSPPAPCAACRPCGKPQGWFGCTGRRWEGQRGSSLCCRYLCCPWKPAAQRHGEVRHVGWRGDAFWGICCLRWSKICWNCEHDTFIKFSDAQIYPLNWLF